MEYEIRFYYSKNKKNAILNKLDKMNKIKNVGTFYEKTTQYNSMLPGNDFYSKEIDGRYRIRLQKVKAFQNVCLVGKGDYHIQKRV